jgi:transposase
MIAHGFEKREQAYKMWSAGMKKSIISRELQVDYDTLLIWCKRFLATGETGLSPCYQNCGRRSTSETHRLRAIELRQAHSDWGAEYIRLHLTREFPGEKVVQPNQIRAWFRAADLVKKSTKLPSVPSKEWANQALQRVQVDAKEQLKTADDKPCCYLNYIDEHTGAELDAFVFPLRSYQSGARRSGF